MKVKIEKSIARGSITAPSSKSIAHRYLILAAMAEGTSIISCATKSDDVLATVDCLRALGVDIYEGEDSFTVVGTNLKKTAPRDTLYCGESGSTLRFMIPIATLSGARVFFSGAERLLDRPLSVYEEIYRSKEMLLQRLGDIIYVDGPLTAGEYTVSGNISSQFVSGLLLALPAIKGESTVKIIPPYESRSYVKLTVDALKKFGAEVDDSDALAIKINGEQPYKARNLSVEGDFSGAAFIEALGYIGGKVTVNGLCENSLQPDSAYRALFPRLRDEKFPTLSVEECPDLAPVLFALAAYFGGAKFTGTSRLCHKESDRAEAMRDELMKFGAKVEVSDNEATVFPAALHAPSEALKSHGDHRIVMALSVLLTAFGGEIDGAEAVSKSYPEFFSHLESLGIKLKKFD